MTKTPGTAGIMGYPLAAAAAAAAAAAGWNWGTWTARCCMTARAEGLPAFLMASSDRPRRWAICGAKCA